MRVTIPFASGFLGTVGGRNTPFYPDGRRPQPGMRPVLHMRYGLKVQTAFPDRVRVAYSAPPPSGDACGGREVSDWMQADN